MFFFFFFNELIKVENLGADPLSRSQVGLAEVRPRCCAAVQLDHVSPGRTACSVLLFPSLLLLCCKIRFLFYKTHRGKAAPSGVR